VPEVRCRETSGRIWFAYSNGADHAVAVDATASVVAGGDPDDSPLAPTVFAPGRVSPAFFAITSQTDANVTWQVTGPDGQSRTATADAATRDCGETSPGPNQPGLRAPDLAFSYVIQPGTAGAPDSAVVTVSLVGDVGTSACAPGLDARPTQTWVERDAEIGLDVVVASGTSLEVTVPFQTVTGRMADQ
jgi:hypothetical protein